MAVEARKTLAWGTTAGAVLSALLLALNGGGMPRLGVHATAARIDTIAAPAPSNRNLAAPAPAARDGAAPRASLPGAR